MQNADAICYWAIIGSLIIVMHHARPMPNKAEYGENVVVEEEKKLQMLIIFSIHNLDIFIPECERVLHLQSIIHIAVSLCIRIYH